MRFIDRLSRRQAGHRLTDAESIHIIKKSLLVDAVWYRSVYPDLGGLPIDVPHHYFTHGAHEGRNPQVLFDTGFYLQTYKDVAQAKINPLLHFITHGAKEGRNPHPRFETEFYCGQVSDDQLNGMNPLLHYQTKGWKLGLFPSRAFDPAGYLALNPDVRAAGLEPLGHLIQTGRQASRALKRAPVPADGRPAPHDDGFQSEAYAQAYPDVVDQVGRQPDRLLEHWRAFGAREGRTPFGYRPYRDRSNGQGFRQARDGIRYFGLLDARSGLGSAARGYVAALVDAGCHVTPVTVSERHGRFVTDLDGVERPSDQHDKVNIIHLNADMLQRFVWDGRLGILNDTFNIGIWAWELAHFPAHLASVFGALDEVWVPSEFCRAAVSAISPIPVVTMPHVVEIPRQAASLPRDHFRVREGVFVFACIFDVGSVVDRKNPAAAVRAFIEAFGDREDVLLILKYHSPEHYPDDVRKLHNLIAGHANIRLFGRVFDEQDMASFRSMVDCFVSPHRSEGFGLNIAEGLLLGKVVIATNYSGNVDFMDEQGSLPIAYSLKELGTWRGPYPPEAIWAEPDVEDLAGKMRWVLDHREEADARARVGRDRIRRDFSRSAVGARMKARLDELGLFGGNRTFLETWKTGVDLTYRQVGSQGVRISVVVPVYDIDAPLLDKCVRSVLGQTYDNWELILHDDGSRKPETLTELRRWKGIDPRIKVSIGAGNQGISGATNAAVALSSGEFIAFLDNDDELAPIALAEMAAAIASNTDVDLLYSDEDKLDFDGSHCEPYFKPDWSPEHLESVMYLLHLIVVRRSVLLALGGLRARYSGAQDYDLALRLSRAARGIVHVPKILYHWRKVEGSASAEVDAKPYGLQRAGEALIEHVNSGGRQAAVEPGLLPGHFRVRDVIAPGLPVTLAIFTDNRTADVEGRGHINLFDHFLNSILERTRTPCDIRILAVDNGNLTEAQRRLVARSGGGIASYDGPRAPFNFSKKANFALRHVKTDLVVLLNDDMEVMTADWLDALVEHAKRPTTGIVGARLLYPDNRIQHCGIVLGINGHVAHVYHQHPADQIGYCGFPLLTRNYLAVTGACMATRMGLFEEIGGFDETFAVDYNDIDVCLRAHAAGYRNIYTPFAQLYHFEGTTQVRSEASRKEHALFVDRWHRYMERDPFYNVNLTRKRLDFSVGD